MVKPSSTATGSLVSKTVLLLALLSAKFVLLNLWLYIFSIAADLLSLVNGRLPVVLSLKMWDSKYLIHILKRLSLCLWDEKVRPCAEHNHERGEEKVCACGTLVE